jgi:hypothetical protein
VLADLIGQPDQPLAEPIMIVTEAFKGCCGVLFKSFVPASDETRGCNV